MPFLLRTIIRNRWYADYDWLPPGEIPADALRDLGTHAGVLSVWEIDDEQNNLERVLSALAATRDSFQNVDYILIDCQVATDLGVRIEANPGNTADPAANESWHRDLTRLTAGQLTNLAIACRQHGQTGRCLHKRLRSLVLEAVSARQLHLDRMNESLAVKVREAMQPGG